MTAIHRLYEQYSEFFEEHLEPSFYKVDKMRMALERGEPTEICEDEISNVFRVLALFARNEASAVLKERELQSQTEKDLKALEDTQEKVEAYRGFFVLMEPQLRWVESNFIEALEESCSFARVEGGDTWEDLKEILVEGGIAFPRLKEYPGPIRFRKLRAKVTQLSFLEEAPPGLKRQREIRAKWIKQRDEPMSEGQQGFLKVCFALLGLGAVAFGMVREMGIRR